jgi:hypothetical protein
MGRAKYVVRISRRGPAPKPFGWEILRVADASEVARSSKTFPTRAKALADTAKDAAAIAFDIDPEPKERSRSLRLTDPAKPRGKRSFGGAR